MLMLKIAPLFALCIAFALSSAVNGSDENVVQGQRVRTFVAILDYTAVQSAGFLGLPRSSRPAGSSCTLAYSSDSRFQVSLDTLRTSRDTKAKKEPRVQQEIADTRCV